MYLFLESDVLQAPPLVETFNMLESRKILIVINLREDETALVAVGSVDESRRPIYTILHFDCNFARWRKRCAMHRHTYESARNVRDPRLLFALPLPLALYR